MNEQQNVIEVEPSFSRKEDRALPALSTGTGTNRLSTYDAASHGLGTWKMKGFGNEAPDRTVQVMACLFSQRFAD